jgi:hypothetical protein
MTASSPGQGSPNVTPIETYYGGYRFRSRLEARWAAFFDRIGWQYTYEPFDGAGYIPDFLIHGEHPLLDEVKPVVTAAEFEAATAKVVRGIAGVWQHDVLIVGADPLPNIDAQYEKDAWLRPAGLLGQYGRTCGEEGAFGQHVGWGEDDTCECGKPNRDNVWDFGTGLWFTCTKCDTNAVHHALQSFAGRPCGHHDGDGYLGTVSVGAIRAAWADASNAVRWESR